MSLIEPGANSATACRVVSYCISFLPSRMVAGGLDGALGLAHWLRCAAKKPLNREGDEEAAVEPQRDVAQSVEVSSKALGATDHGASPGKSMRTVSGSAQMQRAMSVSSIIRHRLNQVTWHEGGHGAHWCGGESGHEPHDQMKVFHHLTVTTTGGSHLHSQQILQLGAVPISSVSDSARVMAAIPMPCSSSAARKQAVTRATLLSVLPITSKQRSANLFGSSAELPYTNAS